MQIILWSWWKEDILDVLCFGLHDCLHHLWYGMNLCSWVLAKPIMDNKSIFLDAQCQYTDSIVIIMIIYLASIVFNINSSHLPTPSLQEIFPPHETSPLPGDSSLSVSHRLGASSLPEARPGGPSFICDCKFYLNPRPLYFLIAYWLLNENSVDSWNHHVAKIISEPCSFLFIL